MSILPGWSSLESTANWVWGFHVAGLVFILLLAASEILASIYGKRADTLRDIAESVRAEKRQQEINEANAFHAAEVEALKREMGQAERKPGAFQREPTDRQLSPAQGNALIQALSPFRGQKIRVVCGVNDVEACRFAEAFKAVFVAAGWNCDGVTQAAYIGSHPLGIEVTVNQAEGQAGRIPQPADRLMKALIVLGLSGQEISPTRRCPPDRSTSGSVESRPRRPPPKGIKRPSHSLRGKAATIASNVPAVESGRGEVGLLGIVTVEVMQRCRSQTGDV